jgi:CubicO group peptidase (beta-lactamase class C family)
MRASVNDVAGARAPMLDVRVGLRNGIQHMQKRSIVVLIAAFALAIAAESEAQPWVARHGMTSAQYQSEFNTWTGQGFRLTHVSGYTVNGQARFAAIWEQKPGPAWVARHGMTSAQYQSEFNTWVRLGYRLVVVDGYEVAGEARYAALWEQKSGPAWVARHGMTSSEYQNEFNTWVSQGYRLTWVEGYAVGPFDYYAAIWEKTSGPAWVARHGMTSAAYQSEFDTFTARGFRLTHVSGYTVGGTDYYAAIWDASGGPAWVARHRLTSGGYQHEFTDRLLQGYRLKLVDGYSLGSGDRYAAIWEAEPTAQTGSYCANGQCFDLNRFAELLTDSLQGTVMKFGFEIRRGLSVIQHAEGLKRTAADAPSSAFTVWDRFNPASVSKTVTAVAVLQLLAKNRISINTPIYYYLPTNWTIPQNNKTITFKEVLTHTSGLRGVNAGGLEYSHVKTLMEDEVNLGDKVQEYENVNYAVLRILAASLDGYNDWVNNPGPNTAARFIQYVNASVFNPLGIYGVEYKPVATAPTLFYPNPPESANGTTYGDWSLRPGSAGVHVSLHELAVFGDATFKGLLLSSGTLSTMKQHLLGIWNLGTLPDGSQCWGHNGFFPASWNNGAELSSVLVHCSNGLTGMLVLNGEISSQAKFMDALKAAFVPQ